MPLINRMTRLFRADMHAVLDCIEEPVALLSQSVRDMSAAISKQERNLALLQQEQAESEAFQQQAGKAKDSLDQEIQLCLDSDQEELARGLIRKRLEIERLVAASSLKLKRIEEKAQSVGQQLGENRAQLASMEQKLVLFQVADSASQPGTGYPGDSSYEHFSAMVSDEDVEVALLAEKQRRAKS